MEHGGFVALYVDALGFTVTHTWTPDGKIRWCWLEHGGATLMLQEWTTTTSLDDPDGWSLHFESPTDVAEGTEYDG